MIIDKIAEQIFKKTRDIANKQTVFSIPNVAVFISPGMYQDMCGEINGQVSSVAMEFVHDKKILGYPVFRVIDDFSGYKILEIKE